MRTLTSRKILKTNSSSNKEYIRELCFQTPFLVINTSCVIGKYKFNKIGYDNNDDLVLEYILVNDRKYNDTPNISYKLGKFYYLSAEQVLYAFKYFANT